MRIYSGEICLGENRNNVDRLMNAKEEQMNVLLQQVRIGLAGRAWSFIAKRSLKSTRASSLQSKQGAWLSFGDETDYRETTR